MRRLCLFAALVLCVAPLGAQEKPEALFRSRADSRASEWDSRRQPDPRLGSASPLRRDRSVEPQDQIADPWFGPDKVRHFFTSALLQSLAYGTLRATELEHGSSLAGASVVTAGFGIGKELRDRRRGYGFSVRDLVWDAAGAAAASVLLARTQR